MAKQSQQSLQPEVNLDPIEDRDDEAVKDSISLLSEVFSTKNIQDQKNMMIQRLFESGFEVRDPAGPRKIGSKLLYQAIWRTANRMKPLDFTIHGEGRPEFMERLITMGVSTIMDKGGYNALFRGKGGIVQRILHYGDSFNPIGTNPDKDSKIPFKFSTFNNNKCYFDNFSNGFRNMGDGRNVTRFTGIYSYSWESFVAEYPDFVDKAGPGEITSDMVEKDLDRDITQEAQRRMITDVAHHWNIGKIPTYVVYAGGSATILKKLQGKDYPFMKDGEPYIPVLHNMGMPSSEGLYNHGIGDLIYDLAIVTRRLINMEVAHAEDNTYPLELINMPKGQAAKFFGKLGLAHKMRAAGKKGFVAMEYDVDNPSAGRVDSQTLLTQSLVNEWKLIFDTLANELKRMGINIDELDPGGTPTATQILSDEENANSFVKQIAEYNASETQFTVEVVIDMIKEFIPKNDKTPLNLTTNIEIGGEQIRPDGVTMGQIADELRKHNYFVKVNSRSGAIPSNIMLQTRIIRMLQSATPGSPAWIKLTGQLSSLNDLDIAGDQFLPQQAALPPGGGGGGGGEVPEDAIATGTERKTINPRRAEQVPAL